MNHNIGRTVQSLPNGVQRESNLAWRSFTTPAAARKCTVLVVVGTGFSVVVYDPLFSVSLLPMCVPVLRAFFCTVRQEGNLITLLR